MDVAFRRRDLAGAQPNGYSTGAGFTLYRRDTYLVSRFTC
jgi:hypothetical protein